jgi:hypothetical protein
MLSISKPGIDSQHKKEKRRILIDWGNVCDVLPTEKSKIIFTVG